MKSSEPCTLGVLRRNDPSAENAIISIGTNGNVGEQTIYVCRGGSREGERSTGVYSYLRLTGMDLATFGVAYAAGGIIAIIVIVIRVRRRTRVLGIRVAGNVGRIVGVALHLVGHDGRYAGITVVACVTARLNKVFRRVAGGPRTTILHRDVDRFVRLVLQRLVPCVVAALPLPKGRQDDVKVDLRTRR